MKGTIVNCLEKLVVEKFGKEKWDKSLKDAGMSADTVFFITADVDDAVVMALVGAVCKNLGITLEQAADAYGEYWVNVYALKYYRAFYGHKTAKEFLLNMDYVHIAMTQTIENAHPPRFTFEWEDNKTLIMHYKSKRGLIDFVAGLTKGVGIYYKENLSVTKIGDDKIRIVFS
jgi:hypothetical protein